MKKSVFEIVSERILTHLEQGVIPWRKPWMVAGNAPRNLVSGKSYRGINIWLLSALGYESPHFLTFRQCKELGGTVKAGSKSCPIVYWSFTEKEVEDAATGEKKIRRVGFLKYFSVFNLEQVELPEGKMPKAEEPVNPDTDPIEAAEAIVKGMPGAPAIIETAEDRACYLPFMDVVRIPRPEFFKSMAGRAAVLFHELSHATGHESRLNRPGVAKFDRHGSEQYGFEELIAEFSASYLCAMAGVENETIENSAAYIQGWSKAIRKDPKLIVQAASQGEKAARYILGEAAEKGEPEEIEEEAQAQAEQRRAA